MHFTELQKYYKDAGEPVTLTLPRHEFINTVNRLVDSVANIPNREQLRSRLLNQEEPFIFGKSTIIPVDKLDNHEIKEETLFHCPYCVRAFRDRVVAVLHRDNHVEYKERNDFISNLSA